MLTVYLGIDLLNNNRIYWNAYGLFQVIGTKTTPSFPSCDDESVLAASRSDKMYLVKPVFFPKEIMHNPQRDVQSN